MSTENTKKEETSKTETSTSTSEKKEKKKKGWLLFVIFLILHVFTLV
jgi:hypothetical protein